MAISNERMMAIEAEMAKFEKEIGNRPPVPGSTLHGTLRPPMMPGPALRFLPHAVQNRPLMPHMPHPMGMMPSPMSAFIAHTAATINLPPGHPIPQPPPEAIGFTGPALAPLPPPKLPLRPGKVRMPTGPIIEGRPTRYMAPGIAAAAASGVQMPVTVIRKKQAAAEDAPGPSKLASSVMAQDMELIQQKKQNEAAFQNSYMGQVLSGKKKPKRFVRTAGGQIWEDPSLAEWDPTDYRLFCGDLGNEVSDELLAKAFRRYSSFQKAKVVRDKRTNKTRGYGFVSFTDPQDFIRAMREMDGKYVGNRPVKLRKSNWRERNLDSVKKRIKDKNKMGMKV